MACTLMVVERFCPLAVEEKTIMKKNKDDKNDFFITYYISYSHSPLTTHHSLEYDNCTNNTTSTNLFYYLTKNKSTMSVSIILLNITHDILQRGVIVDTPLH